MKEIPITDAELEVMKVLWDAPEGLTTGEVRNSLDRVWERTTVLTLLTRLCEKSAVSAERRSRSFLYRSLIKKEEYGLLKTQSLLSGIYNGSIKNMMAALCDAGGLSKDQLRELQELLDKGAQ